MKSESNHSAVADLLSTGIENRQEAKLFFPSESNNNGFYIGLSGGGKNPLIMSFHLDDPGFHLDRKSKFIAWLHQKKIQRVCRIILKDPKIQSRNGVELGADLIEKITKMFQDLGISEDSIYGESDRGFYRLSFSYWHEIVNLLKKSTYNSVSSMIIQEHNGNISTFAIKFSLEARPREELKQQDTAKRFFSLSELNQELFFSEKRLPHPPFNNTGPISKKQYDMIGADYIRHHMYPSYTGGRVFTGDMNLRQETAKTKDFFVKLIDLPELSDLKEYKRYPENVAVVIRDMAIGYGDIYEAISFAILLSQTQRSSSVTLVLPRDAVLYNRTQVVLESFNSELNMVPLRIAEYHSVYDANNPFDLAIYPSARQKFGGYLPAKVSILLQESGITDGSEYATFQWNHEEWGGISIGLSTGFQSKIYKYGANQPLSTHFHYGEFYKTKNPEQSKLLSQIKKLKSGGHEVVVAYPGGDGQTTQNFFRSYTEILQKTWQKNGNPKITILIVGDPPVKNELIDQNSSIQVIYTGRISYGFLQHLYLQYISKKIPSLVSGSMSFIEAMQSEVPFFHKSEPWKRGNHDFVINQLRKIDIEPKSLVLSKTSGKMQSYAGGSVPVELIYFDRPLDEGKLLRLRQNIKSESRLAFNKMPEAIFGWYGILNRVYETGDYARFAQTLSRMQGGEKLNIKELIKKVN